MSRHGGHGAKFLWTVYKRPRASGWGWGCGKSVCMSRGGPPSSPALRSMNTKWSSHSTYIGLLGGGCASLPAPSQARNDILGERENYPSHVAVLYISKLKTS